MLAACILAGGRATRLGGRHKSLVTLDGATILERQLDVLGPRCQQIIVAVAAGAAPLPVPARWADRVELVSDAVAGAGPIAGIAAALAVCRAPWMLLVAGDLPHLGGAVLDLLIAAIAADLDAVAPRLGGLPEPLCCAYAAAVAPIAARRLAGGRRKASGLLTDEGLRVRWIDEPALRAVDPTLACFSDVDTPLDLVRLHAE